MTPEELSDPLAFFEKRRGVMFQAEMWKQEDWLAFFEQHRGVITMHNNVARCWGCDHESHLP